VLVEFGDLRGKCPDTDYQTRGYAYSLDGGVSFVDAHGVPGATQGDPWLAAGSPGVFYSAGIAGPPHAGFAFNRATIVGKKIVMEPAILFPGDYDRSTVTVDPRSGDILAGSSYFPFGPTQNPDKIQMMNVTCKKGGCSFDGPAITVANG